MEQTEIQIWVILTLYGGVGLVVLGTGLFALVEQFYVFGAIFSVVGLVGIIDAARRALGHGFKVSNPVLAAMLLLTWIFFGFDVYDRHHSPLTPAEWNIYNLQHIEGGTYSHETVSLDGKEYEDSTFDSVVFQYEGTAPTRLTNVHFVIPNDPKTLQQGMIAGIKSHNPIVQETALVIHLAEQAAGCKAFVEKRDTQ